MTQLAAVIRGLLHRGGSTLVIFLVSIAAVAAAAAGPIYYEASRTSVLRDLTANKPLISWGFEASVTGPVAGVESILTSGVIGQLDLEFGTRNVSRLFKPPIMSLEGSGNYPLYNANFPVVWRTDECAHLRFSGTCPQAANQILVGQSAARVAGWHTGQVLRNTGWPALKITGIYQTPDLNSPYWAPRAASYFPAEEQVIGSGGPGGGGASFDAVFTARSTLGNAPARQQGAAVMDVYLNSAGIRQSDIGALGPKMTDFTTSQNLALQGVIVSSQVYTTTAQIEGNWRTIAVPVLLVTLEVLTLSWLLLFMAVSDAVEARGPEVALAKLRGHGRWRTLVFGLSEPVILLLAALPLGMVIGWLAAGALGRLDLGPGTPTAVPGLAWAAAGVATAGGLAAVILAAQRTLRRGVVQEFRRSGRRGADRGWVMDAILLTGSAAGLLELGVTGRIGSAHSGVLSLLVPGLLGMAVAVVASRLLPLACRAAYEWTGKRGGLAAFLAIRHIARRAGGTRTTIVLATSFALTSFAVAAWAVSQANYRLVAQTRSGAPVVLTVTPPAGRSLPAIVDRLDPRGTKAAVVDNFVSLTGSSAGDVTLGVDPSRFAHVAFWPGSFRPSDLNALARRLEPTPPDPLVLTGNAMRMRVDVRKLSLPGELLTANVTTGATPVNLGSLPAHGAVTLRGPLVGCPCVLESLSLGESGKDIQRGLINTAVNVNLTIESIELHVDGRWRPVPARFLHSAATWREGLHDNPPDKITAGPRGLSWQVFTVPVSQSPTLASANRPAALPALIPSTLLRGRTGPVAGVNFEGNSLALEPIGVTAVPGAPGNGVIVDRQYAELASNEDFTFVNQQVWTTAAAEHRIVAGLKAAGVVVGSVSTEAGVQAALARQGPGLASTLFLADAAAAALLAVGAAILNLYLSARRRRYEYAALEASGIKRSTLRRALLIELAVVLGFGTIVGIAAGLGAAALVLRAIPEFVSYPSAPPLVYTPPAVPLAVLLGVAISALVVASIIASTSLISGVKSDQLREAPA